MLQNGCEFEMQHIWWDIYCLCIKKGAFSSISHHIYRMILIINCKTSCKHITDALSHTRRYGKFVISNISSRYGANLINIQNSVSF